LARSVKFEENTGKIVPALGVVWFKLHCFVEGLQSLIDTSQALQRGAERGYVFRLRHLTDRAREPLQRVFVLGRFKRQQAGKMQCVGVISIERKSLLAAELRIERTASLQISEAKLTERVRRRSAGTL
jgi:hypothetical protein